MAEKAKILICDDEQGVRQSFNVILGKKYDLAFVNDGPEALEHLKTHPVELILLDIKMPQMDGLKVLKEVKKINPTIKVIIVTGYSTIATAYRAIKCGASDYIPKPFDKDYILNVVEKVLKE